MEINQNNYQLYFLDYFEHSLESHQVAELMVFLEANPELNSEFESYDPVFLDPEQIKFDRKGELKKRDYKPTQNIGALNYEERMVAGMENDLSKNELDELQTFLNINPEARLEYNFFLKSRLSPDPVEYENKNSLKKKGLFVLYRTELSLAIAIAASMLIFFGLYFGLSDRTQNRDFSMKNFLQELEPISWQENHKELNPISLRNEFVGNFLDPVAESQEDIIYSRDYIAPLGNITPVLTEAISMSLLSINQDELLAIDKRYEFEIYGPNEIADPASVDKPSFAMRFLGGTIKNIFGERNSSKRSFLEYTIEGYNLMSDREVEVEKRYDNAGNIVAYQVNGEVIKIGRKVEMPPSE